ncbi:MAG: nicotinate phosphoribosyltransferase [Candidatus Bathyarchaeia archaeon]
MKLFHTATDEEVKAGETTDVYFIRTREILKAKGLSGVRVVAEVTSGELPAGWPWAILCGIEEVAHLFEGFPVDVYAPPEGSVIYPTDHYGVKVPHLVVEGAYGDFCHLETPMLGFLCQASGAATMAARIRKIVGDKLLISFGIRRMHPALCPMIDRAAYIGGFDGASSLAGAKIIGRTPTGTMPHALIIAFGDQVEAWKAFDEIVDPKVPRVALVDTYYDEKTEAVMAADALGSRLYGVRLDTPKTRRGNFADIIREVRWELDIRGYKNVKIIVSGGIDDKNIKPLCDAGADGFGVGTSISGAPTIDFAFDIVEREGKPAAKRGKLGGKKEVWRCPNCLRDIVCWAGVQQPRCPCCLSEMEPLLKPLIKGGRIVGELPKPDEIRSFVLDQLRRVNL